MNFDEMGLSASLMRAVVRQGYTTATPIQQQAIPLILEGHDVLGCAQTGTGKTAAFALPTLHLLSELPRSKPKPQPKDCRKKQPSCTIGALVLTPTRELANQIQKSFTLYGRHTGLKQTVIYGGVSQNPQVNALRAGTDIVIATPGRLLDLMNQGRVKLQDLKILILDEADQMLDMGFINDLKKIASQVPKVRQTLMFSATMPPEIRRLSAQWLNHPHTVQATPVASTPEKIRQTVTFVEKPEKPGTLIQFLQTVTGQRQLVFCRTKRGADRVVRYLKQAQIQAMAIHGDKSQNARERALEKFSSDQPPVLVATDVAARGLHMPGVSHVINYDLPETPEIYVHRIGRTARAGAAGRSISFCSLDERPYLKRIEKLIKRAVQVLEMPAGERPVQKLVQRPATSQPPRSGSRGKSAPKSSTAGKSPSRRPRNEATERSRQSPGKSSASKTPTSKTTPTPRPPSKRRRRTAL